MIFHVVICVKSLYKTIDYFCFMTNIVKKGYDISNKFKSIQINVVHLIKSDKRIILKDSLSAFIEQL